jgi:hypothetical protein
MFETQNLELPNSTNLQSRKRHGVTSLDMNSPVHNADLSDLDDKISKKPF